MSCQAGFSPASSTDPTCLRNCAIGITTNPAYYADGETCWPTCPPLTTDIGPVCTKTATNRTSNIWTLRPEGDPNFPTDYTRRLDVTKNPPEFLVGPSDAAGCPPGFTAFQDPTTTYPGFSDKLVSCFAACPVLPPLPFNQDTIIPDPTQTTLNSQGTCLVSICPVNESVFPSPNLTLYPRVPQSPNNTYIDENGNVIFAEQNSIVCDRSTTAVERIFDLPKCPRDPLRDFFFKSAQFFDSNNDYVNTYSGPPSGMSTSDPNYPHYFSCTVDCPSGQQRLGDYCFPTCPDDGDFNFITKNVNNHSISQYFSSINEPSNSPKYAVCLPKLSGTTNPTSGVTNDLVCASGTLVNRWKPAIGPDAETTAAYANLNPTPLYQIDPSSSSNFQNQACVDSSVCGSNFPAGFSESASELTVYCNSRSSTCAQQSPGFVQHPDFANLCVRGNESNFSDPKKEQASQCDPYHGTPYLYGKPTIVIDTTVKSFEFAAGIGYSQEIRPNKEDFAAADTAYDSSATYVYGDIVGTSIDTVKYFLADGVTPWVPNDPKNPLPIIPNQYYGNIKGPYFRCILAHTGNGTSNLPTVNAGHQSYAGNETLPEASNQYWTTSNIPTRTIWLNARVAGENGFLSSYCSPPDPVTGQYSFCPQICSQNCGGADTSAQWTDPLDAKKFVWVNTGTGPTRYDTVVDYAGNGAFPTPIPNPTGFQLQEYVSEFNPDREMVASKCFGRCASSGQFSTSGNLCLSKVSPIRDFIRPGFSWCPDNTGNEQASTNNIAPSNPQGKFGSPVLNYCLSQCPAGTIVNNVAPQNTCVTECPSDTRFVDSGTHCIKVPYLREGASTQNSNDANITEAETTFSSEANSIAKFSLSGGNWLLIQVVAVAALVCFFIVLVLLVMKHQRSRL